ncbi:MAG: excinuclease ABC subunit UvrC [Planctomycetota bacterium]|jgi:excinuclease ABC subunit C|nr:excinuclease ABC subunit UvrC [Planctomycetota bacterium]
MSEAAEQPVWYPASAPEQPGVYLFKDREGAVLYVGKARNVRSRLASYRRPGGDGRPWLTFLNGSAQQVQVVVTRTEQEALLLEDALIKEHRPPHNIRLKDDKSFLMLRLDSDERFPRLKLVRAHNPEAGRGAGRARLFGPYANAGAVRRTLVDLHRLVPLRDCPDSVMKHRSRACLKHSIGLCAAPCVDLIDEAAYGELVRRATTILAGDTRELEADLTRRMEGASAERDYERAAHWRDRLEALRRTVEGQGVRPRDRVDRDVLALKRRGHEAVFHRLIYRGGRLTESRAHGLASRLPDDELLHAFLSALYGAGRRTVPGELILGLKPAEADLLGRLLGDEVRLVVPRAGERRRMLELAEENAHNALVERCRRRDTQRAGLAELAELLAAHGAREAGAGDGGPPDVIDCFDISNTQAAHVVASRVRFRSGQPDKHGYRRFRLRDLEGQDDAAAMEQVVGRALRRGIEQDDLPQLVVVDGGPQQLAAALRAREEVGAFDVELVGLAKARPEGQRRATEERLFFLGREEAVILERRSAVRLLLERIRDEAHRFAITYHRKERGRITSQLDAIPGVGPVKRKRLLKSFGSVAGVKRANVEELANIEGIGPELARVIVAHLRA